MQAPQPAKGLSVSKNTQEGFRCRASRKRGCGRLDIGFFCGVVVGWWLYVELSAVIWRLTTKNGGYPSTTSGFLQLSLYYEHFLSAVGHSWQGMATVALQKPPQPTLILTRIAFLLQGCWGWGSWNCGLLSEEEGTEAYDIPWLGLRILTLAMDCLGLNCTSPPHSAGP